MKHLKNVRKVFGYLITAILFPFTVFSCQSNESKAEALIFEQVKKTKHIENYEPISTTVKEAKQTPFNDSITCDLASKIVITARIAQEALENASGVEEYNPQGLGAMDTMMIALNFKMNELVDSINYRIAQLDTNKVIGYEIYQYAQGKLKNGTKSEAHLRVITDTKFSKILIFDETTSSDYMRCKNIIQAAIERKLEKVSDEF